MEPIKILLVGCGRVGKSLIKLLSTTEISNILNAKFVGILDRKLGSFLSSVPLEPKEIHRFLLGDYTFEDFSPSEGVLIRDLNFESIIEDAEVDVMIDVTTTNYESGEPSISYMRSCLLKGINVITSNKGPVAFAYNSLSKLAREKNVSFKFESTVMSGTPLFSLVKNSLRGCEIKRIRGVLSGTVNYIFSKMEEDEIEFEDALKLAVKKGYTEKDYNIDLKGIDARIKTVILANVLMGGWLKVEDIPEINLEGISLEKVKGVLEENRRYKLITDIKRGEDRVEGDLSLEVVGNDDPLYSVHLNNNKVIIYTDILGKIVIGGPGSGPEETAYGIVSDLFELTK